MAAAVGERGKRPRPAAPGHRSWRASRRSRGRQLSGRRVWGQRPGQPHTATYRTEAPSGRLKEVALEFSIRGRHMDVPDRLRTAVQEKVTRLARHLDGWEEAEVQFFEERN